MKEHEFEYGAIAKGMYIALICITPVIPFLNPDWFLYYLGLLAFLGFCLRFVLETSGLHHMWTSVEGALLDKWDRKFLRKRRMQIDRQLRDEKYRKSRHRDPRLPKNW